jgi:hypothetical protein
MISITHVCAAPNLHRQAGADIDDLEGGGGHGHGHGGMPGGMDPSELFRMFQGQGGGGGGGMPGGFSFG